MVSFAIFALTASKGKFPCALAAEGRHRCIRMFLPENQNCTALSAARDVVILGLSSAIGLIWISVWKCDHPTYLVCDDKRVSIPPGPYLPLRDPSIAPVSFLSKPPTVVYIRNPSEFIPFCFLSSTNDLDQST